MCDCPGSRGGVHLLGSQLPRSSRPAFHERACEQRGDEQELRQHEARRDCGRVPLASPVKHPSRRQQEDPSQCQPDAKCVRVHDRASSGLSLISPHVTGAKPYSRPRCRASTVPPKTTVSETVGRSAPRGPRSSRFDGPKFEEPVEPPLFGQGEPLAGLGPQADKARFARVLDSAGQ